MAGRTNEQGAGSSSPPAPHDLQRVHRTADVWTADLIGWMREEAYATDSATGFGEDDEEAHRWQFEAALLLEAADRLERLAATARHGAGTPDAGDWCPICMSHGHVDPRLPGHLDEHGLEWR
jgi:hypothetical protein